MGERAAACWLLLLCASGLLACAPRPVLDPRPGIALTADLARADALVRRGSYASLQDALAIYERLAAAGDAPAADLRAIETALLLALRERELGLAGGRSLERAVELANRQPPPSDVPDDRQDRLVAARERDILKVQLQQARSCYNAAVAYANLGEPGKARPFAERALAHPEMKSLAEQFLARLGPS